MKKFDVYRRVIAKFCDYLVFIETVVAENRNDACLMLRDGEYRNSFLTAKLVS